MEVVYHIKIIYNNKFMMSGKKWQEKLPLEIKSEVSLQWLIKN